MVTSFRATAGRPLVARASTATAVAGSLIALPATGALPAIRAQASDLGRSCKRAAGRSGGAALRQLTLGGSKLINVGSVLANMSACDFRYFGVTPVARNAS